MLTESRPWGQYTILEDAPTHKVKRIVVNPHSKLSYQSHANRSEDWTIVSGEGIVLFNDAEYRVKVGHHFKIPVGSKHRMINDGDSELVFIEVQTGTYFGEDDIIRYSDDYNRV